MIFKTLYFENPYSRIVEMIRKDLVKSLEQRGINLTNLTIDMDREMINISIGIATEGESPVELNGLTSFNNALHGQNPRNLLFR